MAESTGIIVFTLWYIFIAYNYYKNRGEVHSYSARSSQISLLDKAGDEEGFGHKKPDTLQIEKTAANAVEESKQNLDSVIGDAVEVVHAVKETVEEFDVDEDTTKDE